MEDSALIYGVERFEMHKGKELVILQLVWCSDITRACSLSLIPQGGDLKSARPSKPMPIL